MTLRVLRIIDILPLPPIYYDLRKDYHIPDEDGGCVAVNERQLSTELKRRGFSSDEGDGRMSETAEITNRIQRSHAVDFTGRLAGWKKGFHRTQNARLLITESPALIVPVNGPWDTLHTVFENTLGEGQLPYFYGWLKVALEALNACRARTGQALVLCGQAGAGKNLLRALITAMFGGRVTFPYQFMTEGTAFNHDLFGAETLAIEDEAGSRDFRSRQRFGSAIKKLTANEDQRYHRKFGDPLTLSPCQRLIISLNNEPVRLLVLPPIESDIADKLIIFKVAKREMPMPTDTTQNRDAFWAKLKGELPAFLHYLTQWQIPESLRCPRFGVIHYHHPELLEALQEFQPEDKLLELIDEAIFAPGTKHKERWTGKAEELRRELLLDVSRKWEVDEVLPHQNSCGTLLGRLRERDPGRIDNTVINGRTHWTVKHPEFWEQEKTRAKAKAAVDGMRVLLAASAAKEAAGNEGRA